MQSYIWTNSGNVGWRPRCRTNMECGEDKETDTDVDNTFLKERIWDDLENNEISELDNSFRECSGCDSSSNEVGDIENDTGNSFEQSCVRGCGKHGTIRRWAECGTVRGYGRGRGTDSRGDGILKGSGTDQQSSSATSRGDVDPTRRRRGLRGCGRRQSTTQYMNFDWTVISSG